jgi:hypothetical protein
MTKSQLTQQKSVIPQQMTKQINLLADFYCTSISPETLKKLTNPKPH